MFDELKKQYNLIRIFLVLGIFAVSYYLFAIFWQFIQYFSDLILILVFAWLLSFILEPFVNTIHKISRLPRILATVIAFLLISFSCVILIFMLLPEVTLQLQALAEILPSYFQSSPELINRLATTFTTFLNNSFIYIPSVAQYVLIVLVILVISFYLIIDKEKLNEELYFLIPQKWHSNLRASQDVIDHAFATFLRLQVFYGLSTWVTTWIILTLLHVDFAASASFLSGFFAIIPVVGPVLALVPPLLVTFITDPTLVVLIFVLILIVQQILLNFVVPRLLGQALRVHPVIVIIGFFVGYKVAGFMGAFFVVPVIGILSVVARELIHTYLRPNKDKT